jgi:hypothetical protein
MRGADRLLRLLGGRRRGVPHDRLRLGGVVDGEDVVRLAALAADEEAGARLGTVLRGLLHRRSC